jgi:hypothetical protein
MQLAAFHELRADFIKSGIAVHHITAEVGGSEAVVKRLKERGLKVTQALHSSPDWSLMCIEPKEQIYFGCPISPKLEEMGYEAYTRVEPALVVIDAAGDVVYRWSWHALAPDRLSETEYPSYRERWGDTHPNAKTEENPTGNSHDVRWRPKVADLLARLQRGGRDLGVEVASVGFPSGEAFEDHTQVTWR